MTNIDFQSEHIITLGRCYQTDSGCLAFDWTNSGVYFRFVGSELTLQFDTPALNQRLFVQTTIDGRRTRSLVTDGETTLRFSLEDGEHRVNCVRVNEILDGVPLILRSVTIDGENAQPRLPQPLPNRRMLFIGDSITCGFGVLTQGTGNGFKTDEQDGAHTYAALTAAHFQAQAHFICISGRGIARNCDNADAPLIPEFFEKTTVSNPTPWDHTQYQPDIIVVNAGTNDTAGEDDPVDVTVFQEAVAAFIRRLRAVYPNAKILWLYGMMAGELHEALQETITALDDDNVTYQKLQSLWGFENEQGACTHPNLRCHYRCAGVVIDKVAELTGWDK